MAIFHSYVKLPEGIMKITMTTSFISTWKMMSCFQHDFRLQSPFRVCSKSSCFFRGPSAMFLDLQLWTETYWDTEFPRTDLSQWFQGDVWIFLVGSKDPKSETHIKNDDLWYQGGCLFHMSWLCPWWDPLGPAKSPWSISPRRTAGNSLRPTERRHEMKSGSPFPFGWWSYASLP